MSFFYLRIVDYKFRWVDSLSVLSSLLNRQNKVSRTIKMVGHDGRYILPFGDSHNVVPFWYRTKMSFGKSVLGSLVLSLRTFNRIYHKYRKTGKRTSVHTLTRDEIRTIRDELSKKESSLMNL